MTNAQVFGFTTLISPLAAPYVAVLSFLVF
jgi:hypothetical protein